MFFLFEQKQDIFSLLDNYLNLGFLKLGLNPNETNDHPNMLE